MDPINPWQLDPTDRNPLHAQLVQKIAAQIQHGNFEPGKKLPSERALMLAADVSRATVRQALATLVHQGLLEKIHGSGTYIAYPKYEQPLQNVYSFSEQMRQAGYNLVDTILRRAVLNADGLLAARLDVPEGEPIVFVRRLRSLHDQPIILNNSYIPLKFTPGLPKENLEGSLYRMLIEKYHQPILRATDRMEAINADRPLAALLEVPIGTALMFIERKAFTTGDVVLHIGENFVRGDRFRFRTELYADKGPSLEVIPSPPNL